MRKIKDSNSMKRISIVTALILLLTSISLPITGSVDVEASEKSESFDVEQVYEESANSWRYENGCQKSDGSYPLLYGSRASFIPWSKTTSGYINSKGDVISGAIKRGVDVSAWQGKVNWTKVKADDIDFAIIRCGFGSDEKDKNGKPTRKQDDSQWMRNVSECERLGIPYGVYLYSYANSEKKARSEAEHTLRLLKEANANPDYPVYYDLEDDIVSAAGNKNIVKYAKIYCEEIEKAGYEAGIYANLYWWNDKLGAIASDRTFDNYEKWVAQYNYRCDYKAAKYRIWQCSSSAYIDGIDGKVDLNFEFSLEEDEDTVESGWTTKDGKKYYIDSTGKPLTGYKKIGNYYYFFDSSGVMKTGTIKSAGKEYKLFSSGIACIHSGKTNTAVNYRTGPSTSYAIKGTYKKGVSLSVIRTYNGWSQISNGYWLKSSYVTKSTVYPKSTATTSTFKKYNVKVKTALNYRTGPSTSYKKKGMYNKGKVLTIVASKNGWGKTSTGYWVKLSYTKKI